MQQIGVQRYIVTQPHPNTQIQEEDLIYIAIQQCNDDIEDGDEFGFASCGLLGCCDDTQAEMKSMQVEVGVPQDKLGMEKVPFLAGGNPESQM